MTDPTEAAEDRLLRAALGPKDAADLSRAVLTRLAAPPSRGVLARGVLARGILAAPRALPGALAAPLPAAGAGLALLLAAGAAGYALLPALAGDGLALFLLTQGVF